MSRDEFKMSVTKNGGKYQSSVSKKTDYLVCNDESSATTKVNKARALGVQVINEAKYLAMVKDGSDGFAIF
jgi:DNA ligase (NAD+)